MATGTMAKLAAALLRGGTGYKKGQREGEQHAYSRAQAEDKESLRRRLLGADIAAKLRQKGTVEDLRAFAPLLRDLGAGDLVSGRMAPEAQPSIPQMLGGPGEMLDPGPQPGFGPGNFELLGEGRQGAGTQEGSALQFDPGSGVLGMEGEDPGGYSIRDAIMRRAGELPRAPGGLGDLYKMGFEKQEDLPADNPLIVAIKKRIADEKAAIDHKRSIEGRRVGAQEGQVSLGQDELAERVKHGYWPPVSSRNIFMSPGKKSTSLNQAINAAKGRLDWTLAGNLEVKRLTDLGEVVTPEQKEIIYETYEEEAIAELDRRQQILVNAAGLTKEDNAKIAQIRQTIADLKTEAKRYVSPDRREKIKAEKKRLTANWHTIIEDAADRKERAKRKKGDPVVQDDPLPGGADASDAAIRESSFLLDSNLALLSEQPPAQVKSGLRILAGVAREQGLNEDVIAMLENGAKEDGSGALNAYITRVREILDAEMAQ
jgi:hypothetical protein